MQISMMKLVFMTSLFLSSSITPAAAETIRVNFDDWCPYSCMEDDHSEIPHSKRPGYELDIINLIFNKQGIKFDYLFMPWARAITEATAGRLDALLSPGKKEAPGLMFPEESIGELKWCFYTLAGSKWNYSGVDSLEKVTLGYLEGNVVSAEVQDYIDKHKDNSLLVQPSYQTNWIDMNFNKLAMGRITAILDEQYTLDYHIKETGKTSNFRKAGCLNSESMYIAFSPENPRAKEYTEIFDAGLRRLRASGELKTILENYGLDDWN
ncbi:transporter substrate-binding domain-containing protein [Cocleimonas flava]|uniref:Amino acid ABC transporter substrate-binding protein (PAAT family) n=2 Tax=Thiotrichaceae TaxID=135617 RepID=A0A4R1EPM3_9GAMM|nr:amino acid ABC transporter substrate-binding protein (PAAT family) [Cocleimonas flava]